MATEKQIPDLVLENRRIMFRNFSGEEGRFNAAGTRNFNVALDPEEAAAMLADGWNVKQLKPREEDDLPQDILKVQVKFGKNPPKIVLITDRGKTELAERQVRLLDWAEITNVDMVLRAYVWDINGRQGVSAYLKSIYVTIREDPLEQKYHDVPDSAVNTLIVETEPEDPEA